MEKAFLLTAHGTSPPVSRGTLAVLRIALHYIQKATLHGRGLYTRRLGPQRLA